jgi:hypothetical protein
MTLSGPRLCVFVGPQATIVDRDRYLYVRISGELIHHAFDWDVASVSVCPDAALTSVRVHRHPEPAEHVRGRDVSGQFRATQVMVRQADDWQGWKIARIHLTRLASPTITRP